MKFECQKCGHEFEVDKNKGAYRNRIICPKCKGNDTNMSKITSGKALSDNHALLKYRYRQK